MGSSRTTETRRWLEATPDAPAVARCVVADLGLSDRAREDVQLVAVELVTNSVRHAGLPEGAPIELRVVVEPWEVLVEVTDGGQGFDPEHVPPPGIDSIGGRGLLIVGRLSGRWGVDLSEGCRVWATLDPEVRPERPGRTPVLHLPGHPARGRPHGSSRGGRRGTAGWGVAAPAM
jgi:anti-sigma regulatory factor (Ser/Thr protein kinase)